MNIFWIKLEPAKSKTKKRVKESTEVFVDKKDYTVQSINITLRKMKTYTTYDFFTGEIGYWTYAFGVPTKICKTPEELKHELERTCYGMLDNEENSRLSVRWTISGQTENRASENVITITKTHSPRRLFEN